jgi:hypothetical protein
MLAIALGAVVALGTAVVAAAIFTHPGEARTFGWSVVRSTSGFTARVAPDGPAAGALRDGDTIVAVDGDRRADRISPVLMRQFVRGSAYTVTVRRGDAETTIPLTLTVTRSAEVLRLNASLLIGGIVWCLVATLIAVSRPERPIARMAYWAGLLMGLFFVSEAPGPAYSLVSHAQQVVMGALFPVSTLHLAVGYDFYLRFPGGVASGRFWRLMPEHVSRFPRARGALQTDPDQRRRHCAGDRRPRDLRRARAQLPDGPGR